MESFHLDAYLMELPGEGAESGWTFSRLCRCVREEFDREWEEHNGDLSEALRIQKHAIIGFDRETGFFRDKISTLVREWEACGTVYPAWYGSLEDGIFHEVWGLAGLAEWFSPAFGDSSSAKVIGDRIYFLDRGRMRLMPQRIAKERREQLLRGLLLLAPEERHDREFHEVYRLDGTRVTVFRDQMTKQGQDAIIFRRYVVPTYTFQEQAERGTIPPEAIPLLEAMAALGYNVAFTGAVRTAKTTFLSTWQSREDPALEGVMVETDPEIPLHAIMPEAPILQILADNERMARITKNLLRSDADYFILAEARDGNALDTAVRIASKGTRRMKITFHCRDPYQFPYDAAWEIAHAKGTDIQATALRVAASFDYVFHFIQCKDKSKKRLYGIYEIGLNDTRDGICMTPICLFDMAANCWRWSFKIRPDKRRLGMEEDPEMFRCFERELEAMAERFPMPPDKTGRMGWEGQE